MGAFLHDRVDGWEPVDFGVTFARRMRRHKGVAHTPSLRTAMAIPRMLAARYVRTHVLLPRDYVDVAVLCTVPEDQAIARAIAFDLVFPRAEDEAPTSVQAVEDEATVLASGSEDLDDPLAGLLGDLADLDVDFDALEDFDALIEEAEEGGLGAFELFERLYSSAVQAERALGELVARLGGAAELQAVGADTIPLVQAWAREQLQARVGMLEPDEIKFGCEAGFGDLLKRQSQQPWELAGALAGSGSAEDLASHLEDLQSHGTAHERGRTLRYLKPFMDEDEPTFAAFRDTALAQAADLSEHGELVKGLDAWVEPRAGLLAESVEANPRRALDAAQWLEARFPVALSVPLFELWASQQVLPPSLEQLAEVAVECPLWETLADSAWATRLQAIKAIAQGSRGQPGGLPDALIDLVPLSQALKVCGTRHGRRIAAHMATEALCQLWARPTFLPMLEAFIEREVIPHDVRRVADHAESLGINPAEVYDRIGDALEQLRQMVIDDSLDVERYRLLVDRIAAMQALMGDEEAIRLAEQACAGGNLCALAALLAVNMGAVCTVAPSGLVRSALGHKGIGGGANLLRQWFHGRQRLNGALKAHIKLVAREALVDLAFDWIGKGDGSCEAGLLPQSRARPFRAGDELDALDLEGTLDGIISAGKTLDAVTLDDLYVHDTARGRAALAVLIDISGSMGGDELAICAIAVVMLLGKLRSEEVALAVFESDTHVIKNIDDVVDLDTVADAVLDLEATGGTCVDAALRWAGEQFEAAPEAELRLLFVLSDYGFSENLEHLGRLGAKLADQGVELLAASHGHVSRSSRKALLESIGGRVLKLPSVARLPEVLLEALTQVGDGLR
jgi:Mg-chelatase subunit ChlD